jgi:hypothetical protein
MKAADLSPLRMTSIRKRTEPEAVERLLRVSGYGDRLERVRGQGISLRIDQETAIPLSSIKNRRQLSNALRKLEPRPMTRGVLGARIGPRNDKFTTYAENVINDWGWYRRREDFDTEMDSRFRFGNEFGLPAILLSRGKGAFLTPRRKDAAIEKLERFFHRGSKVLMPIHPQQVRHFTDQPDVLIDGVRCASSERTVHVPTGKRRGVMVKLDLGKMIHAGERRAMSPIEAEMVVRTTEHVKKLAKGDAAFKQFVAFFPEPVAVVDREHDIAATVRLFDPYPALKRGVRTKVMPMFCLYSKDPKNPHDPSMLKQIVDGRPDSGEKPVDYFFRKIVEPLIKSWAHLQFNLGINVVPHSQNSYFEMWPNGEPTGRIVHSDMESFSVIPAVQKYLNLKEQFWDKAPFEREAWDHTMMDPYVSYDDFLRVNNLDKILRAFRREYPGHSKHMLDGRVDALFAAEFDARRDMIKDLTRYAKFRRMLPPVEPE